jgi:hypothetical protein
MGGRATSPPTIHMCPPFKMDVDFYLHPDRDRITL